MRESNSCSYWHRSIRQEGAFTLIELLIVIAIILILIAIALPNFLGAQKRARRVACMSNLHTLGDGLFAYKLDYNRFPLADGCAGDQPSSTQICPGNGPAAMGSWDGVPWILAEKDYVEDREVYYCPVLSGLFSKKKANLRYAYNNSSSASGGPAGGASDLENDSGHLWICRCAWVPPEASFNPNTGLIYPAGDDLDSGEQDVMENVLRIDGTVERVNGRAEFFAQR